MEYPKLEGPLQDLAILMVELMEVTLKRVKEINPKLNAYLTVAEEEAMQAAREVEKVVNSGAMLDFFQGYDLLLIPATAVPAPSVGKRGRWFGRGFVDWGDLIPFTAVFNLSGNPVASVPCGFTADGLPIGLQVVGRLEDEVTVLRASAAFEEVRPWADKRPPVS